MKALMFEICSLFAASDIADRLLLFGQQVRRPGVRHIGHDLDCRVADGREPPARLGEGEAQVGVGAECEVHGDGV